MAEQSDDDGWEAALDRITALLAADVPFCHVRFGDGELNAACGLYDGRPNCDRVVYTDRIAGEMRRVFEGMPRRCLPTDTFIPGGTCVADPLHAAYLKKLGYTFGDHPHRPDGWVPCHVIAEGVESLRTLPLVHRLRWLGDKGRLWLVGGPKHRGACLSELVEVGPRAVEDADRALAQITELPAGAVVMYCAGTPGKVMAWDAWVARPDIAHLDMGHFFDRAYGVNNRLWHDVDCPRRAAYDAHFAPLVRI